MESHIPSSSGSGAHRRLASARTAEPKSPPRDARALLRARLLKMIVAHEESRHAPAADSLKPR